MQAFVKVLKSKRRTFLKVFNFMSHVLRDKQRPWTSEFLCFNPLTDSSGAVAVYYRACWSKPGQRCKALHRKRRRTSFLVFFRQACRPGVSPEPLRPQPPSSGALSKFTTGLTGRSGQTAKLSCPTRRAAVAAHHGVGAPTGLGENTADCPLRGAAEL